MTKEDYYKSILKDASGERKKYFEILSKSKRPRLKSDFPESEERTLERAFGGQKFDPETFKKQEDEYQKNIEQSEMSEEKKKIYLDILKRRMRTA
jgi:hypothetical protein